MPFVGKTREIEVLTKYLTMNFKTDFNNYLFKSRALSRKKILRDKVMRQQKEMKQELAEFRQEMEGKIRPPRNKGKIESKRKSKIF